MKVLIEIAVIIAIIVALGFCFYSNDKKEAQRRAAEKVAREKAKKLEMAHPAEQVHLETDPIVAAMRAATGQSLRLNLMAEQAFSEMVAVAGMKRTASVPPKNPQDNPWYRQAEWVENDDFTL